METYFNNLMSSSLPLPFWALIVVWLFLFVGGHVLARTSSNIFNEQKFIATDDVSSLVKPQSWRLTVFQILFTAAIFTFSKFAGAAFCTFFVGGWIVITLLSIPLNLRNLLFLRAISKPDAARGSVVLSSHLNIKDAAFKLLGMATFCLILGLLIAHLAVLGGAFFMFATATGYLRKTKK